MVAKVPVKGGFIAFIDDEDEPRVIEVGGWTVFHSDTTKYARMATKPFPLHHRAMHRFIMNAKPDELFDHIDGNGLNNQKGNLRLATPQQNSWNSRVPRIAGKSSRFKGVSGYGFTWTASITFHGTATNLGRFSSQEAAARAYDKAAIECFGEFAKTNEMMGLYEKAK
jgi:hypothetical protein